MTPKEIDAGAEELRLVVLAYAGLGGRPFGELPKEQKWDWRQRLRRVTDAIDDVRGDFI